LIDWLIFFLFGFGFDFGLGFYLVSNFHYYVVK
jgi:hypothetical protein